MQVRRDTSSLEFGHESQTVLYLPVYTVHKVISEQANGEKLPVLSCTEGPAAPDFELPIRVVVNTMKKISGRSWCLLGFCQPQCGQKIRFLQLQIWMDRRLTKQQWDSLHLITPFHDAWVKSNGKY